MSTADAEKLLEDCAEKLGELFDAVQILVSWNEDGKSYCVKRGSGNWYARIGMCHEMIDSDIAQDQAAQISSKLKEGGEGDDWKAT